MELNKDLRKARLEDLLARIDRNRAAGRAGAPELAAAAPALPTEEEEEALELTEEDETIEVISDEEIPMAGEDMEVDTGAVAPPPSSAEPPVRAEPPVPVEAHAVAEAASLAEASLPAAVPPEPEAMEPIEIAMDEAPAPMELEPLAPTEPGEVTAEAMAMEPVEPIELAQSSATIQTPVETLPIAPMEPEPPATIQEPDQPIEASPVEPAPSAEVPEPTAELLPTIPEDFPRASYAGSPGPLSARPLAFSGKPTTCVPRTIGDILKDAFTVGEK